MMTTQVDLAYKLEWLLQIFPYGDSLAYAFITRAISSVFRVLVTQTLSDNGIWSLFYLVLYTGHDVIEVAHVVEVSFAMAVILASFFAGVDAVAIYVAVASTFDLTLLEIIRAWSVV